jgi:hypothetical protein
MLLSNVAVPHPRAQVERSKLEKEFNVVPLVTLYDIDEDRPADPASFFEEVAEIEE